jgi:hypothetical protein
MNKDINKARRALTALRLEVDGKIMNDVDAIIFPLLAQLEDLLDNCNYLKPEDMIHNSKYTCPKCGFYYDTPNHQLGCKEE